MALFVPPHLNPWCFCQDDRRPKLTEPTLCFRPVVCDQHAGDDRKQVALSEFRFCFLSGHRRRDTMDEARLSLVFKQGLSPGIPKSSPEWNSRALRAWLQLSSCGHSSLFARLEVRPCGFNTFQSDPPVPTESALTLLIADLILQLKSNFGGEITRPYVKFMVKPQVFCPISRDSREHLNHAFWSMQSGHPKLPFYICTCGCIPIDLPC
jgi:hypothetical protein